MEINGIFLTYTLKDEGWHVSICNRLNIWKNFWKQTRCKELKYFIKRAVIATSSENKLP